ncbi:alpha/beta hydrolase [Stenotrophomonas maltophilia]|jgi:pimeloyl-ACP methyl ester carboxylesterase|uniref:alpha/beta hydrolase n=1 Tax=Stenotrophomonas TaxID=40323 RepID=UPI00201CAFDE|nr:MULTISPECIES: alpha/beta hydrolase [Stenotrophomonas]MBN5026856.1 alpha/beta fold hydrolase [Stenotrophomonas maltophilia]MDH1275705.1 alpha/beta hydrolase [Stenotrophomonas sp. GD03937]MDH1484869.1 alpha/beta hydrolase [Stenotrophomonas sp. GD03712]MDR2960544.1 alpha/beta hydrolase [Stenotrophomonas sp.]UQY94683.1 alpha/beta hydrolase [Stenotrophomonas maltophilia]
MQRHHLALATMLASLMLAGCSPSPSGNAEGGADAPSRRYGTLAFQPCTLSSEGASANVAAQCTTLQVPEDRARPDGRRIDLRIAWLESGDNGASQADPVFFLAGGPGQAASEVAVIVDTALRQVRKQRDIFLIDQRGTGGSNPLTCLGADGKPLPIDEEAAPSEALLRDYAQRCAASLKGRADARFYTTSEAIADLDAVRQALGVDQLNLVGGSYGTRVAQRYAGAYPQHTRSIVIDGVVPNELVVGGDFANTFEDAITLQAAQCRKNAACSKRFPVDTAAQLRSVVATLRRAPVTVDYRDPGTNAPRQDVLSPDSVVGLAFAFSYVPQFSSLLPLVLDEAAQGRYAPLASLARGANRSMDFQINRGMQWSVICSEDAPRYRAPPANPDRLFGNEVASAFFAACPVWPHQPAAPANADPLRSEVPALLLSGELDPVTPPRYAEQVLKGLPNGRALVARGQGHGTLAAGCMPRLLGQFIDKTDAKALDASCLDTLSYVPAFTSFNGWEP